MKHLTSHGLDTPRFAVLLDGHLRWTPPSEDRYALDLTGTVGLRSLPAGLSVPVLLLDDCPNLAALPEGLDVVDLSMRDCVSFERWPRWMCTELARLDLSGCTLLRRLPERLGSVGHLDLSGCIELARLPGGLRVTGSIDLADTQISHLPPGVEGAIIKWRGVTISARIALDPASITMADVVGEANAERRRVLIERMGYERFIAESAAVVLDRDSDAGGHRELLRVDLADDEGLVCLSVRCPSTADRYMLRVPPAVTTCHQAAAWIAGFDDPADYAPIQET